MPQQGELSQVERPQGERRPDQRPPRPPQQQRGPQGEQNGQTPARRNRKAKNRAAGAATAAAVAGAAAETVAIVRNVATVRGRPRRTPAGAARSEHRTCSARTSRSTRSSSKSIA